ncbi:MAG: hypothetical protein GKS06_10020 [Acidobacteria bacterium]|nr:hypothetical protein [Acidobacteriota bacterium]
MTPIDDTRDARAGRLALTAHRLEPWLKEATKGLSEEATRRVRQEITDHFHLAFDAAVDQGIEVSEASAAAVDSLGPARSARRAFRRTHLTSRQAEFVRSFTAGNAKNAMGLSLAWARILAMSLLYFAYVAQKTKPPYAPFDLWFIAGVFAGLAGLAGAPAISRWGHQRAAVAVGAISEVGLFASFLLAQIGVGGDVARAGLVVLILAPAVNLARVLPKLPDGMATGDSAPQ